MAQVQYDVENIVQEQNPICWVACCAMGKGYASKSSVGVGEFTGGFDPSNSCIANLAGNWSQCTDLMSSWGATMCSVSDLSSGSMAADDLASALSDRGPAVLLHLCAGFPYGAQWGDSSSMTGAHAVLLTGIDTDNGTVTFNNPWGDKDQSADLNVVLQHIATDSSNGKTFGFFGK